MKDVIVLLATKVYILHLRYYFNLALIVQSVDSYG